MISVNKEIQALINEHNMCSKINTFFYNTNGAEEEVKKVLNLERFDRFSFVQRENSIEGELKSWEKTFENSTFKTSEGLIGKIKLSEYGVCFRPSTNGTELPAFFIVIEGDEYNSHLYTIDCLEVID